MQIRPIVSLLAFYALLLIGCAGIMGALYIVNQIR